MKAITNMIMQTVSAILSVIVWTVTNGLLNGGLLPIRIHQRLMKLTRKL